MCTPTLVEVMSFALKLWCYYNGSTLSPKVSVPICLRLLFFFLNKNRLEFSDLCYIIFQQKQAWILRSMLYKPSCQKEARDVFIGCTMWSLDRCSNAMTYGTAVGLKIIGLKRLVRTKFWLLWERAHFIRSDQCNSVAFCVVLQCWSTASHVHRCTLTTFVSSIQPCIRESLVPAMSLG